MSWSERGSTWPGGAPSASAFWTAWNAWISSLPEPSAADCPFDVIIVFGRLETSVRMTRRKNRSVFNLLVRAGRVEGL